MNGYVVLPITPVLEVVIDADDGLVPAKVQLHGALGPSEWLTRTEVKALRKALKRALRESAAVAEYDEHGGSTQ